MVAFLSGILFGQKTGHGWEFWLSVAGYFLAAVLLGIFQSAARNSGKVSGTVNPDSPDDKKPESGQN